MCKFTEDAGVTRKQRTNFLLALIILSIPATYSSDYASGYHKGITDAFQMINQTLSSRSSSAGSLGSDWAQSIALGASIASLGLLAYNVLPNMLGSGIGEAKIPTTTFSDVIGAESAKDALGDIVEILQHPETYTSVGARLPKGVLLEGPPGNGKTLLAKALAGEAHVKFLAVNGADFSAKFYGVGIERVKELFRKARNNAPCIIFIDEIDGIGKRSEYDAPAAKEDNRIIGEFLTQMDGLSTNAKKPVIVLAATNHRELLDPALLRSGRFDTIVRVENPILPDRKAILELYVKKIKTDNAINFDDLAQRTAGLSGADLENVVNQAALVAARRKAPAVQQSDFDKAIDQMKQALIRQPLVRSPQLRGTPSPSIQMLPWPTANQALPTPSTSAEIRGWFR